MTSSDIARQRLHRQRLSGPKPKRPEEAVGWLGAVQAQDFAAAKWAVAQRTAGATAAAIDRAFTAGRILRTHVLRPTWHLVLPADIRWMLALSAPRVKAQMAAADRQLGLTGEVVALAHAILAEVLRGGRQLTRAELAPALRPTGAAVDDPRTLSHLLVRTELDGIICSGAMRGKQHTYALLDERVQPARALDRDEALAALARRYFTSRGPATLKDFAWWSGLAAKDARAGLEMAKPSLAEETVNGHLYWRPAAEVRRQQRSGPRGTGAPAAAGAHLLPNFDEYLVAYADRRAAWDPRLAGRLDAHGQLLATHTLTIDGQIVGSWKRRIEARTGTVTIEIDPWRPLARAERAALAAAAERYAAFAGCPVLLA